MADGALDLLGFENDDRLLSYIDNDNMPLWLYIRNDFFCLIQEKLNVRVIPHNTRKLGFYSLKYLIKAFKQNCSNTVKDDNIALYVPCKGVVEDSIFINSISSFLYSCLPQSTLIMEHPPIDWKWYERRSYDNLFFTGPKLAAVTLRAKIHALSGFHKREFVDFFNYLCKKATQYFSISFSGREKKNIADMISINHMKYKRYSTWIVEQCLNHHVTCLIMVGASYSHFCDVNRLARVHRIYIADLQHGFFTSDNYVYNYNKLLAESEIIKNISPDFFLSYGEWQSTQTNIPYARKITIGNDWHNRIAHKVPKCNEKDIIYVIGCANDTTKYMDLSRKLQYRYPEYNVVFRPHPIERNEAALLRGTYSDISIDFGNELYSMLNRSYLVLSEISTVLFEAIGLAANIAVWRTNYSAKSWRSHPFLQFESFDELTSIVESKAELKIDPNTYWPVNTKFLYYSFLKSLGINVSGDEKLKC